MLACLSVVIQVATSQNTIIVGQKSQEIIVGQKGKDASVAAEENIDQKEDKRHVFSSSSESYSSTEESSDWLTDDWSGSEVYSSSDSSSDSSSSFDSSFSSHPHHHQHHHRPCQFSPRHVTICRKVLEILASKIFILIFRNSHKHCCRSILPDAVHSNFVHVDVFVALRQLSFCLPIGNLSI